MVVRVAVVTGSNKGIGLEIVRSLCQHFGENGVVYLTARDEGRGLAAVELLQKEGLSPKFHVLDVTDQTAIERLRDHLERTHGGIDILINNAGIGSLLTLPPYEQATKSMAVNFHGLLTVSRALIPLVRSGGRVVNLTSTVACTVFRDNMGEDLITRFRQATKEQDVETLMNEFLEATKTATNGEAGWPTWGYAISKLGVVVLSKVQAQDIEKDETRHDILINTCCPGYVKTDMTAKFADDKYGGNKITTVEAVDTPVFLALLPPNTKQPQGQFVLRRQVYDFITTDVSVQICK